MLITENNFNLLYHLVYALSFLLVLLAVVRIDIYRKAFVANLILKKITITIVIALIFIIGFREYNVGSDTQSYYYYNWILDAKSTISSEVLFDIIIQFIKSQAFSFTVFLLIIAALFYINIIKSFYNIGKLFNVNVFFLFFIFISLFFSKSLSINVIRQGLSLSFLLLAYSIWLNNKSNFTYIVLLLFAVITHTTSLIPIVIFIISFIFNKRRININFYLIIYFISIIVSFFNIGILTFAPFLKVWLEGSHRANYLTDKNDLYITGFKPQFVVFNSVFLIFSWYVQNKILNRNSFLYNNYKVIYLYYILSSIVFFMTFQIPYSDRFGLFSWIVIPILISPFFTFERSVIRYKTPFVLFFLLIYIFFAAYGN
ncbi:EpsG family protein [Chryseobacterium sp.]|uniref:EpsG family protein n=1 Tax=Chryseobacterium sp. TaxID=1871047 RepID=UPI0012CECF97|nr:EpsG family protein [Chryseobacterium sp.]MPS65208.1 EpsG family protein [Chryseobacterium sp.]